jgi:hypothetical protein
MRTFGVLQAALAGRRKLRGNESAIPAGCNGIIMPDWFTDRKQNFDGAGRQRRGGSAMGRFDRPLVDGPPPSSQ